MYQGDTVRLKVNFKSFTGQAVNPVNPTLTIYKTDQTVVETITDLVNEGTGQYYYDYVPELSEFIFEFSGQYNDKPILVREKVETKFI